MSPRLLALLRISERPDPPPGAGDAVAFRASPRHFWYTAAMWAPKQLAAFFGLVASLAFFGSIEQDFVEMAGLEKLTAVFEKVEVSFGPLSARLGSLFLAVEALAIAAFLFQLVASALLLRTAWRLRWYIVGDRVLRIREGIWSVREQTLTVANIQNMTVRRGPVQRLFGIADLEIRTAGGGARGGSSSGESDEHSSHRVGRLRGLENAAAIRDRIAARLAAQKSAGLGDTDDPEDDEEPALAAAEPGDRVAADLAAAAEELAAGARALHNALG